MSLGFPTSLLHPPIPNEVTFLHRATKLFLLSKLFIHSIKSYFSNQLLALICIYLHKTAYILVVIWRGEVSKSHTGCVNVELNNNFQFKLTYYLLHTFCMANNMLSGLLLTPFYGYRN